MPIASKGIPNRKSVRLSGFDYSQPGGYFITINTKDRKRIFGEISDGKMLLSPIGEVVKKEWQKLSYGFVGLELVEFVIMPDHTHGVIILHEMDGSVVENAERFSHPQKGSLSTIVRSFKSSVSVRVHQMLGQDIEVWQRNYFEEFIEDDEKLDRIREYIKNNPLKESYGG
ncbi:MAG: transposase [Anaerolineaceae bacterium]